MAHADRKEQFFEVMGCPIKCIPLASLKLDEIRFVARFIEENKELDDRTFKGKAHYLFLDGKDGRDNYPHHIQIIEVLMSICATS